VTTDEAIARTMQQLGRDAVAAQRVLSNSSGEQRNQALRAAAAALRLRQAGILAANERDMSAAAAAGLGRAALDRLQLDPARIEAMARGVEDIAALPDPIGTVLADGHARTDCGSSACACRSASSASSTKAGRT